LCLPLLEKEGKDPGLKALYLCAFFRGLKPSAPSGTALCNGKRNMHQIGREPIAQLELLIRLRKQGSKSP
jgi:hypothetical protein